MINIEEVGKEIVEQLKPLAPVRIVLFGSYADGTATEDSDIDLYVVTNDDFIPQSWREKSRVYQKVAKSIQNILRKYPTDLIVHTKKMYQKAIDTNHFFITEIEEKGIRIYG